MEGCYQQHKAHVTLARDSSSAAAARDPALAGTVNKALNTAADKVAPPAEAPAAAAAAQR
jgi:hypothetical protein